MKESPVFSPYAVVVIDKTSSTAETRERCTRIFCFLHEAETSADRLRETGRYSSVRIRTATKQDLLDVGGR